LSDQKNSEYLADLADGTLSGPEWDAWLADNPEAADVEIARKVRALMAELRAANVQVPEGFEARLMERLSGDTTLMQMLDLWLAGVGRILAELFHILLSEEPPIKSASTHT
jgi:hypothetical protein